MRWRHFSLKTCIGHVMSGAGYVLHLGPPHRVDALVLGETANVACTYVAVYSVEGYWRLSWDHEVAIDIRTMYDAWQRVTIAWSADKTRP